MQCDRSAYTGPSSEVDSYYVYLKRNYPTKKWYRGRKTVFERPVGFNFYVRRESRMVKYFKLFFDSGIYSPVSNRIGLNAALLREREGKDENKFWYSRFATAIRLGDSIQTIFILLAICVLSCVALFVVERGKYNISFIMVFVWTKLSMKSGVKGKLFLK